MGPRNNVVDQVIDSISNSVGEYETKKKNESYDFKWNLSNVLMAYGRINDLATLTTLAFNDNVLWFGKNL